MTGVVAGMMGRVAGMTGRVAGMTGVGAMDSRLRGNDEGKDAGMMERDANPSVIPVKTGNQRGRGVGGTSEGVRLAWGRWIPAYAGMTGRVAGMTGVVAGVTESVVCWE